MHRWQKFIPHHRYPEILQVCLPLVLSLSATTVMEFTDRIFLANYSVDAISAAVPAGITSYLFLAFFGGVGGYAGVFIAQYTGRGEPHKIGSVLWQAIYFTLGSGLFLSLFAIVATEPIFALAGHAKEVQELENIYFSILCHGSILHIGMTTLATFFTGRGITRPVMLITFIGTAINIPLNYAMIFGRWGFAEMGIGGAALATVTSWAINVMLLCALIFTGQHNRRYRIFSAFSFNRQIFARLLRFGVPGALQFTLDILAFTLFILLVGRIGVTQLAATNIVLSINALAFMPSMGASQGIRILVGQSLGKGRPSLAATYVRGGWQLLLLYILLVDLLFVFAPELVLTPFINNIQTDPLQAQIMAESVKLLKIVALYLFFDALYMIYSGALTGAGDTRFMMLALAIVAPIFLVIPVYLGISYFAISVTTAWLWVLIFITVLFLVSALRYRAGAWRKMLVIEPPSHR